MDEFATFVLGFVIGSVLMLGAAIYKRDIGRDECEANLPRTVKCIQKWVAP